MKLTSVLLLGACLQVSARVHSQTVSYSGTNVPLEKIFAAVEKQTGYVFFFDEAILKDARPVTIRAENYSLSLFLSCVLSGQPFRFSFQNKTIVISRTGEPIPVPTPPATDTTIHPPVQQFLRGMVMDANGIPLSGASVTIKGSGKSTLTDGQGGFSIPASARNGKLIISYVGYNTREITLSQDQGLLVQLTVAVNALDEEVVQGYGKTSQRLAVANIIQVSGADIQKQPVMNPLLALNGRVPGMLVTPISGYISAPVKVEIRGRSTIDPTQISDPLYVIDGVPLTILDLTNTSFNKSNYANGSTGFIQAGFISNTRGQSPLFSINPADIESISVLKDAAATAIYGSRGANGVILITTKKTQPGKTRLNIQVQQSTNSVPRHWDMLNTQQYVQMRREALKNDALPISAATAPDLVNWDTTRYTDWQKKIWGVAKSTDAQVSLSGGDRLTSFNLGVGFTKSQDITTLSGTNQRISISSSLSHHSQDQKLTINLMTTYGYTYVSSISMPDPTTLAPNAPPIFDARGNLNYADWNAAGMGSSFPFAPIRVPTTASSNFITGSLRLNYVLAKGLNMGVQGGYNNAQTSSAYYNTIAAQNPVNNPTGIAGFGSSNNNNWDIEPQLNYALYLGKGKLDCMAGGTLQGTSAKGTTTVGFGYSNDALLQSPSNALGVSTGGNAAQRKYANIHGRLNYNWQNKYILELVGNRDGSSSFGPGRQFGNFWSVGGAWIASEEEWMKRILPSWWSLFKLNGSYGVTGQDGVGAYQYLSQWSIPAAATTPAYNGVAPIAPIHAVNQDYHWQENRKINADLSLSFLKDRINLTVTYYRQRCNNQLTGVPTPSFTGFNTVTANSPANVQNDGWEGYMNARIIESKVFSWTLGFNIGINRNKLLGYPDFELSPYYTTLKIGKSLNTIYVYHYLGINPQNGQRGIADYNHDGIVTAVTGIPPGTVNDDRYVAIDLTPKYSGGISNQFTYKRCMLSLFFNFKKQLGALPYTAVAGSLGNVPLDVFNNHWQKPGDLTRYTRFSTFGGAATDSYFTQSDGAYTDASFLRLNNLSFSYSLPETACKKAHMQGVTLSIDMSNVFTITSYKGIDPEVNTFGTLPQSRNIAGRIAFNF
jgi:TonB-linked SusC/RagA family outer membrane protein